MTSVWHSMTFFINIKGQGFIKNNPFANVSLKKNAESVRNDFIAFEGIDKLKDLSTVDYNDKISVRDRCVALLAYDLALRIGGFIALDISDLHKIDDEWGVRLRSEVQKGTKPEDVMYFFFPETTEILEKYLTVRGKFHPKTDHLFVSNTGSGLEDHQCRKQFKQLCQELGIKTYDGNEATPHHLRHSFATLNIEPLGLSLPAYDIMQRLHHTRLDVTMRHYMHNNPYLKKIKHNIQKKNAKKKTSTEVLNEVSLAELEHWLSDTLKVEPAVIGSVRIKHKKAFSKSTIDKEDKDTIIYISEAEAIERLKNLSITAYALRKYSLKKGVCLADGKQNIRYGKDFKYKEEFIADLAANWVSRQVLMTKMNLPRSVFYQKVIDGGWRTVKIGKMLYVYKPDCV